MVKNYGAMIGIPTLASDYNYPEILVPRGNVIIIVITILLGYKLKDFYGSYDKRCKIAFAKEHQISSDLDFMNSYARQKNLQKPEKSNLMVFCEFIFPIIKTGSRDLGDIAIKEGSVFPELTKEQKLDFFTYFTKVYASENPINVLKSISGILPKTPLSYWIICLLTLAISIGWIYLRKFLIIDLIFALLILGLSFTIGIASHSILNHVNRYNAWSFLFHIFILMGTMIFIDAWMTAYQFAKLTDKPKIIIEMNNGNSVKGYLIEASPRNYYIADVNEPKIITQINLTMVQKATTISNSNFLSIFHK